MRATAVARLGVYLIGLVGVFAATYVLGTALRG